MTWPTAIVSIFLLFSTLARLDRLERAAYLVPGKDHS